MCDNDRALEAEAALAAFIAQARSQLWDEDRRKLENALEILSTRSGAAVSGVGPTSNDERPDDGYSDVRQAICASRDEWDEMDWRTQSWYVWLIRSESKLSATFTGSDR